MAYRWKFAKKQYASKPERQPVARMKKRRQQRLYALATVGTVLFFFGFLIGRISAPEKIVEVQVEVPQSVQVSVTQDPRPAPQKVELPWNLMLINGDNPLTEDFVLGELTQLSSGMEVDARIYPDLQRMMDDARAQGLEPLICSAYRTHDYQEDLYENKVTQYLNEGYDRQQAEDAAARWVQRPDTSEHQAGLAVDIVDMSYQLLDESQEETAVQIWLMEHCADYGFILRYPTDKSEITGIGYEPWHYRYVGYEAAQEIMERGICLEEYLQEKEL